MLAYYVLDLPVRQVLYVLPPEVDASSLLPMSSSTDEEEDGDGTQQQTLRRLDSTGE
jgi:hypothetical protein